MITLQFKDDNILYWTNTKLQDHRLGGKPARQTWWKKSGNKKSVSYWEHDRLHRLHGKPSFIRWRESGFKWLEEHYEDGRHIYTHKHTHTCTRTHIGN